MVLSFQSMLAVCVSDVPTSANDTDTLTGVGRETGDVVIEGVPSVGAMLPTSTVATLTTAGLAPSETVRVAVTVALSVHSTVGASVDTAPKLQALDGAPATEKDQPVVRVS